MIEPPIEDIKLAQQRNLEFELSFKTARGKPWSVMDSRIMGLEEAFRIVNNISDDYFEIGVFMQTNSGGFKYWSSADKKGFNSSILELDIESQGE